MKNNRMKPRVAMKSEYPVVSIAIAVMLILLSPFTTPYLNYVALLFCIYRVLRYDAKIFATDYCMLVTMAQLFRTPDGMTLLVWLCLLAAVWYFIRNGVRANSALVCLLILLNYLILRMQMNINDFVLCFGQVFVVYVLIMRQDQASAERAVKYFCWSLFATSIYALLFRGTRGLEAVCGAEVPAFYGSKLTRFQGIFTDPNNYMSLVIIALALLCKLKDSNRIKSAHFWILMVFLALFGGMSYSKTYLLVLVILGGVYIIWQFWNKRAVRGVVLSVLITVGGVILLVWEASPLAVIMDRFATAENLSDLTTGRTEVYAAYVNEITQNIIVFLFGKGLKAEMLAKDPHNLYLEILYLFGAFGLILLAAVSISITRILGRSYNKKQNFISRHVVLWMVLVVYMTLNGITGVTTYTSFFLAYLAIMITKRKEVA